MSNVDVNFGHSNQPCKKGSFPNGHDITDNDRNCDCVSETPTVEKPDSTLKFSELPIEIIPEIGFEDIVLVALKEKLDTYSRRRIFGLTTPEGTNYLPLPQSDIPRRLTRPGLYLRGDLELIEPVPVTIYQWGIPVKILNLEPVDPIIPIPVIPLPTPIEVGKLVCDPSYGNTDTLFKIAAVGWFIQGNYDEILEYKFIARNNDAITELQDWNVNDRIEVNLPVPCTLELHIRDSSQTSLLKAKNSYLWKLL